MYEIEIEIEMENVFITSNKTTLFTFYNVHFI